MLYFTKVRPRGSACSTLPHHASARQAASYLPLGFFFHEGESHHLGLSPLCPTSHHPHCPVPPHLTPGQSMTDLFGQTWQGELNWGVAGGVKQSDWKNAPGLIRFLGPNGPDAWQPIAVVTRPAARGTRRLTLSGTNGIEVGMWLSFSQVGCRACMGVHGGAWGCMGVHGGAWLV